MASGVLRHVKRLDADAVAADQQAPLPGVPQRKVEHAVQAQHEGVTLLYVAVQEHLAVGAGLEDVALRLEFGAQFAVVVDLTVAH